MNDASLPVPGSSAAPLSLSSLQAVLPTGMYAERRGDALILESDRRHPRLIAVAVTIALLVDVAGAVALSLVPLWQFAIIVMMATVPLTLFALARAFNIRRVEVTPSAIRSTSTPVPWFGDRHVLEVGRLKRLFVSRSGNTVFERPASALWWESDTGRRGILIDDLPDDTIAGLLEAAIEEHLGLDGRQDPPGPVDRA